MPVSVCLPDLKCALDFSVHSILPASVAKTSKAHRIRRGSAVRPPGNPKKWMRCHGRGKRVALWAEPGGRDTAASGLRSSSWFPAEAAGLPLKSKLACLVVSRIRKPRTTATGLANFLSAARGTFPFPSGLHPGSLWHFRRSKGERELLKEPVMW